MEQTGCRQRVLFLLIPPGVVKKCLSPTHALVDFRYGETKVVPISFITPVGGAMPCPQLQVPTLWFLLGAFYTRDSEAVGHSPTRVAKDPSENPDI